MRALVAFMMLVIASCGAGTPVYAHDWFNGTKNPKTLYSCCYGGPSGDCQPLAEADWWREGGRYHVRHRGTVYSIPADQALPSRDPQGRAAACILGGRLRCFFVPLAG